MAFFVFKVMAAKVMAFFIWGGGIYDYCYEKSCNSKTD
ncbi:MAG: hypothetical protein BWX99_00553 [Deltaproteobacteria bacterium ADurb.Bin151]|nr:MAG: hypothetical protein BWX99_00553 [Deltaproteobacteria bacterium ADurb.Bin151]